MAYVMYEDVPSGLDDPNFCFGSADDTALLISDHGQLFELNVVGAFIWDLLDGRRTVGEIIERLAESFDVDRATAERDLMQILQELFARGMVVQVEAA